MNFATPVPARPTLLSLAESGLEKLCLQWLIDRGHVVAASEVRVRLRKALGFSADAYRVARYLDDNYGFPADELLVGLIRDGLLSAQKELPRAVKTWVVETGIRFPGVASDPVMFHDGGMLALGTVHVVRHEFAEAVVTVFDDTAVDGRARYVCVKAEDIARDTS